MGVFRLVGGKISKSNAINVTTPSSTIGIRGGICMFEVSSSKTTSTFVFGNNMTVSANGQTQNVTRPGSHELALPASPARLKVPSLPSERPLVGPRDLDRTLPSRLAEVPRERPPRSVRLTSTGDVLARPAARDVPEVARALTPPGPLPAPSAPDLARASPPALPRLATLPRVGKELPSLAAPPPEPSMLAAARPAPTPPKTALPVAPPSGAVALGAPAASTQGSGPVTVEASDFPFAWYLHAVQRKITEKWAPPTRGDGRALVVFEISRNGEVKRTALEGSSGDAVYDQAALRAIADATPFPPLPEQYKSSILKIHLGFSPVSDRG